MIARRWHGVVPTEKADAYVAYLTETGLGDYERTPGNRGVLVLRSTDGDKTHFEILTLWESMKAVAAFAGPDIYRARYYPLDQEFLEELEPYAQHQDVVLQRGLA